MRTIDLTFKELNEIKLEISKFIGSEFPTHSELQQNNLRFILKQITFLKYMIRQSDEYKYKALTSDVMYLISTIKTGETRYYYFNLRSIIEHALRIINNISSTDRITNEEIMQKTKIFKDGLKLNINLDIIREKYRIACFYVHGSEDARMELVEFYQSCFQADYEIEDLTNKLNVLVKLMKELTLLILVSQNSVVDSAFHRRKSILKYLVGESSFNKFQEFNTD